MKYHIITFGCQMNKSDSERIASYLEKKGYKEAEEKDANLIIINACSVRKSATDRIHGKVKKIKEKPTTVLTGCILKRDKAKFSKLFDYILQSNDLAKWPLFGGKETDFFKIPPKRKGVSAFIPIMTGCDNFCTYCVVPYTKGREVSRPAKEIIEEAEKAVSNGYKEIWLLGQNVNSYNGEMTFPDLLRKINKIKGDFWIRFVSSHPKDFSDDLIRAMSSCKKVVKYLNLPLQSGDDEILKKMNRPYTSEDYKNLIERIRKAMPDIELSTDIIVGFPEETEENFRNTAELFREIKFDMAYISCYSPRPQTVAYKMKETVSDCEKKRREKILTEILKENNAEKTKKYKGKEVKVLVFEKNKKGELQGKTAKNKTVLFSGPSKLIGRFVKVKITQTSPWSLKGEIKQK